MEEIHRSYHEKFSSFQTHIESTNWSIRGKTNWPTRQQWITWFPDINGCSVWVDEFESAILIPIRQFVLRIPVLLGVLSRLVRFLFLGAISSSKRKCIRFAKYEITYLTSSSLRHPFPMKASFGCRYLWKVFLITQSVLTLMPTCSSNALIFVLSLFSPPSAIMMTTLPPSSTYRLISYSSCALNGRRGPPRSSMLHSFNLFRVMSVLFISHL